MQVLENIFGEGFASFIGKACVYSLSLKSDLDRAWISRLHEVNVTSGCIITVRK